MSDHIKVVNMIPFFSSGETNQDSEPNLAVNPGNSLEMAATAFTLSPNAGSPNSPIFYSNDGGNTWALLDIIGGTPVRDQTLRFSSASGILYAGVLWGSGGPTGKNLALVNFDILRTNDFSGLTVMTRLASRVNDDQPFVQAATVNFGPDAGKDRIYIGSNDHAPANIPATIDFSLDAAAATPATSTVVVESRTVSRDGFQTRPAIHRDGIIYAAYYALVGGPGSCDIVIVRDDNWGSGAAPFNALVDQGDEKQGVRITTGVNNPFLGPNLGQQRLGGDLSIAVDPNNSATVYVCWGDVQTGGVYTLHVRKSTDSGVTWSPADLRTIANATNPALAINNVGRLGFLYQQFQQVTAVPPNQRWQTMIQLTTDDFASVTTHVLADTPAFTPAKVFDPYLGDYLYMMADGNSFHGVFSANNTPDTNNFPSGVAYQRIADFAAHTLLNQDNTTPVAISIDPFFFTVAEFAACVIAGVVTDANGTPLPGVFILLSAGPPGFGTLQISTDSRGRYSTPVVPAGVYDVSAVQDEFAPADASVTVFDAVLLTIQNFVLERTLPFTIIGLVTDTTGAGVGGASVRLTENGAVPGILTTQTDKTGQYSFNNVDPGPFSGLWDIFVRAPGYVPADSTFTIANGATLTENFVLVKQGLLSGHVTDINRIPLGGASVTAGSSEVGTDKAGLYSMVLDPGQYTVTATLPGFRPSTNPVGIPIGATVVNDFVLVRAVPGSITGTVTDDGGTPISHATLTIPGSSSTGTDAGGKYTFPNLHPGSYQVKASAGARYLPETSTVTVFEGEATVCDFSLVLRKPI